MSFATGSATPDLWTYVGSTKENEIDIPGMARDNTYEVVVVPRAPGGARKRPGQATSATTHLRGKTSQPSGVTNTEAHSEGNFISLRWEGCFGGDKDVNYYEVREGAWWGGRSLAMTTENHVLIPTWNTTGGTVYVKARDKSDNWSDEPVVITYPATYTDIWRNQSTTTHESNWSSNGTTDMTETGSVMRTTGLAGVYSGNSIDIGAKGDYYVMVSATTKVTPQELTIDRCGFLLDSPYAKRRLISELTGAGSMEGSENRDNYIIDDQEYTLDSLYANLTGLDRHPELDDQVTSTVEWRTSENNVTWSDWYDGPAAIVEDLRYVQARVNLTTAYTGLSMDLESLRVEVTQTSTSKGIVDPGASAGSILYMTGPRFEELTIGAADTFLVSNGSSPKWWKFADPSATEGTMFQSSNLFAMSGATTTEAGAMTAADKTALDNVTGDFATYTGDLTAADIPIVDAGSYFAGTEVETALQELGALTTSMATGHYEEVFTATGSYIVSHNLNEKPQTTVLTSAGKEVDTEVLHDTANQLTLTFKGVLTNAEVICDTAGVTNTRNYMFGTKTDHYTLQGSDRVIYADASVRDLTITLPTVIGNGGRVYNVKKIDSTVNTVTVDGNADETIDGGTTAVLTTQYEAIEVHCNGSEWFIL